jgi:hypothetical protein
MMEGGPCDECAEAAAKATRQLVAIAVAAGILFGGCAAYLILKK